MWAVPAQRLSMAAGRLPARARSGASPADATPEPTGRFAAGCWMCLRDNEFPVTRAQLDVAWLTDTEQRDRALNSLLADGLVTQTSDGRFALVGEEG